MFHNVGDPGNNSNRKVGLHFVMKAPLGEIAIVEQFSEFPA